MSRSPNIVLVMADQHRGDMMGCAGDVAVQTPNLDRLAAEGVRFSRATCQGPLCMPARASFMTERYVRDHGVYTNWAEIDPASPTYAKALKEAGYRTAMIGKAHLYRDDTYKVSHIDELAPRLMEMGFDEVYESGDKFSTGVANRYTDHLRDRGLVDLYKQYIRDRAYQGEQETGQNATKRIPMWDSTPLPIPLDDYIDAWEGREAVRWIEQTDTDQPFFVFIGFPGPHDPWDAPVEAVERYKNAEISMPATTRRPDLDGTGNYGKLLQGFLGLADSDTMTDDAIHGMRRAYSADISVIDDAVGSIVAALDAKGVLDDTWIVYTSDHGEMAGNHGLMSKCVLYDPAVHVPLIVRPAKAAAAQPGQRVVDALVEHVDLAATVRDIAGAPDIDASEGRSLLGHIGLGAAPQPRDVAISENWGFASFQTDRFKLVVDEDMGTPCQLFDLHDDPNEDENRVADPECKGTVEELMETYVRPFLATPPARPHKSPFTG